MPKVTIIVPSYNHVRFVKPCVESVLAQTFSDWEMIVVDDGSTDGAFEAFQQFTDPRIKVHQNEQNLGTYGTQNRAVALFQADLIAILNDDDTWAPTKLEAQIRALEKHPDAPFCYTRGWRTDENGAPDHHTDNYEGWPLEERLDLVGYLLDFNRVMASSIVFRREWAEFDTSLNYSGDWKANLRAACSAPPVCVLEKLTDWRQHGENTSQKFKQVTREEVRMRRSLIANESEWLARTSLHDVVKERLGTTAYHLCALEMLWGCVPEARKTAQLALKYSANKSAAAKRLAVCLLPRPAALKKLFPTANPDDFPRSEIDSLPGIDWKLPEKEK